MKVKVRDWTSIEEVTGRGRKKEGYKLLKRKRNYD